MLTNIRSWCNLHKGGLAYCSRRIWSGRDRSFSSLIGFRHAMQRHSGGRGCLRPLFHWPNRVKGWWTAEHCCKDRDANVRLTNPSKSSMYKYHREVAPEMVYSTQPTFSTNLFNQPFRPIFSTNLLDQPSRPTFSTNNMRFIVAIAAVLSALTMTNATKVTCEAGLAGTNDCESKYCLCNGDILTCQVGTECASFCVCAA